MECNAACDYAPVVMVNWEFFDNMTPQSARQLVDDLRAGNSVRPTRGPRRLCTWRETSRILAGFNDGQATEGPTAGLASLVGLKIANEHGWTAPAPADVSGAFRPARRSGRLGRFRAARIRRLAGGRRATPGPARLPRRARLRWRGRSPRRRPGSPQSKEPQ